MADSEINRTEILLMFLELYEAYYNREYAGDTNMLSNDMLIRDIKKLQIMLGE